MSGPTGYALHAVTVTRGATRVLDSVSAELPAGRCTAILGRSGAGKSTLLRLLTRLDDPSEGRILLDGVPLADLDVLALRRKAGLVTQRPVLLADRVADDVRTGRPALTDDRVAALLQRVGLPAEFADRATGGLSGGEAHRVCLARALALEPGILLLDEPTSALDEHSGQAIADVATAYVAAGSTVVLAGHDLPLVRSLADHVLVLDHGRLVAAGHPGDIGYLEAG